LYCNVSEGAEDAPLDWLHRHHRLTPGRLDEFLYRHEEDAAVRHMFRVATGLDSMVLGEPQILGQVKDAWRVAHAAGTLHAPMDRLLQNAFAVAKRVRTDTRIGAGETIELAARHLLERRVRRLIVANRTTENAQALAGRFGGYAIALSDLPQHLAEADIVLSATAAREPILTRAMLDTALRERRRRPMFLLDLAVPRDIEAGAAELPDVFLYTIDDLRQVIDSSQRSRETAAHDAEAIIELQVERYLAWRRATVLDQPLRIMRADAEAQRDAVLARAREMLSNGRDPAEALEYLANTLTGKLLHTPSVRLREAAQSGDSALLDAAARLFDSQDGRR
jgi:glutamyl-tRNA reductase